MIWSGSRGNIARTAFSSSIVYLSIVAQSFEQFAGLVYQILLHVAGFTHCALISLCALDLLADVSIVLCYISMHVVLL